MTKLILGFFAILFLCIDKPVHAQVSPPCSSFCVTGMYLDTAQAGLLWVTIDFTAFDSNMFINYPHIRSIVTPEGDTIGTGDLWFFGQFGNTAQDYPVTTNLSSIPDNFEVIIDFHFDTVSCALVFPCITNIGSAFVHHDAITFNPNPFSKETRMTSVVELRDATLTLFDLHGRALYHAKNIRGYEHTVSGAQLAAGIYVIQVVEYGRMFAIERVLVID